MKAGQPPKYKTPEDLQSKIDEYFEEGHNKRKVEVGKGDNKQVIEIPVLTVSGLAYYLGFASRQSFYDYEKTDKFSYTIKRARLFIEREYEEQIQIGNPAGAIFALKNFGWTDKQQIEHSNDPDKPLNFQAIVLKKK